MPNNGSTYLVLVNTAADGANPVYTLVGEQRDVSTENSTAEIDASHKLNVDQVVMAGRRSATLSLEACDVPEDAAQAKLRDCQQSGELVLVLKQKQGAPVEKATFLVTGVSESGPDQDVATLSISMTRSGSWLALT